MKSPQERYQQIIKEYEDTCRFALLDTMNRLEPIKRELIEEMKRK